MTNVALANITENLGCFENGNIGKQPKISVILKKWLNRQKGNIVFTH